MQAHLRFAWLREGAARWVALGACIAAGLAIRAALYQVQTDDYKFFISRWYDFIAQNGGFQALKYDLSNYNPPYLYLLAVATCVPVAKLAAVKTISVIFDIVLAYFTYRVLRLRYSRATVPVAGAAAAFLAPTVIINSSAWGQCDAIYTAFCLGSLYFLLTDRPAWTCVFFGLAISFKLQAIFFLPVLLLLLLRDRKSALCLLLVPVTCAVMLFPAVAEGRDVQSLLHIYVDQVETGGMTPVQMPGIALRSGNPAGLVSGNGGAPAYAGGGHGFGQGPDLGARSGPRPQGARGSGSSSLRFGRRGGAGPGGGSQQLSPSAFTFNAPSFYQWLPANAPAYWKWIGTLLAGMVVAMLTAAAFLNRRALTPEVMITLALLSVVALPFLLPKMHERYFYAADVMSIGFAFWFPRYFFVAIIMQLASLLSYAPYFLNHDAPPSHLAYVAIAVLFLILFLAAVLAATLYPHRIAVALSRVKSLGRFT